MPAGSHLIVADKMSAEPLHRQCGGVLVGFIRISFATWSTPQARAVARAKTDVTGVAAGSTICTELLALSTQGRLILERSDSRIVVNRDLWVRLPDEARVAIVTCSARRPSERPQVVLADSGT